MHQLPFGAAMTDALVKKITEMAGYCTGDSEGFIPALIWCHSSRREHFGLFVIEKKCLRANTIFTINGILLHVDDSDQSRSRGRTLDWKEKIGVIDVGTQPT